jgi:hypothetical protein
MPNSDHNKTPPAPEPDEDLLASNESDANDDAAGDEIPSEIARRISLLGKLIIPPAAP